MKLFVCESCEAEFRLKHTMDDSYYKVSYCPFCASRVGGDPDFVDDIEWEEDEN